MDESILLEEISHRINNDLTSAIAFIELTAAHSTSEEVKIALAGIIQHVHELAGVQRALQVPSDNHLVDASTYLRQICQSITRTKLQYRGIGLLFRDYPLKLGAMRCWKVGMIMSELVANAAAFQEGGGGIQVELSSRGGMVDCIVTDNGATKKKRDRGRNRKIVRALAGDLSGNIEYLFGSNETIVTLSFPFLERDADCVREAVTRCSPIAIR